MAKRGGKGDARNIIIRREEAAEEGHHGGAWKVAYADFVTAMMAFFLLMWLINATSPQQRRGIAAYFSPLANVENGFSGAGLVPGGVSPLNSGTSLVVTGTGGPPATSSTANAPPTALGVQPASGTSDAGDGTPPVAPDTDDDEKPSGTGTGAAGAVGGAAADLAPRDGSAISPPEIRAAACGGGRAGEPKGGGRAGAPTRRGGSGAGRDLRSDGHRRHIRGAAHPDHG